MYLTSASLPTLTSEFGRNPDSTCALLASLERVLKGNLVLWVDLMVVPLGNEAILFDAPKKVSSLQAEQSVMLHQNPK